MYAACAASKRLSLGFTCHATFIIGGYNFTFVKRLVLVQIIQQSPFKTQNIIIKQTWF